MSQKDIIDGPREYTCVCSVCGTQETLLADDKRVAPTAFRKRGWVIPQTGGNICPRCAPTHAKRKPKYPAPPRPPRVEHRMPAAEKARLKAAMKERHDEIFGLTGRCEL